MLPLGVDFSGGTIVVVKFDQHVPIDRVRVAVSSMPGGVGNDAVVQEYGDAAQNQVLIRVAQTGEESAGNLSETADAVLARSSRRVSATSRSSTPRSSGRSSASS